MNKNHKELISMGLTLGIIVLSLFIIHHFIPSLIWASIIAIATYPVYQRWQHLFGKWRNLSALLFTTVLLFILILPVSWLITILIQELQVFFTYLQSINQYGGDAPTFLNDIPWIGPEMIKYWNKNLGDPGSLKYFLSNLHISMTPASHYLKTVGYSLAHRSVQLGFTLLSLFFFFRDGDHFYDQLSRIGANCLGERWFRYANKLPLALRSTVNGTIAVGVGVGILMGCCYGLLHFPAPTLTGFITAFAAMIPFVVPLVFGIVALVFVAKSSMISAIIVLIWGTFIMFFADHFIKPALIGGAIELPFLAVLFGILGGVETLGLLGLFVGPVIMVLFMTLWQESQG